MIDLVLVVMSDRSVESLLKSETTLGGDVSLTAGPKSTTYSPPPRNR